MIFILSEVDITEAGPEDAAEILSLQHLAYQSEAKLYGIDDLPPLKETLAELCDVFTSHRFLKAVFRGHLVGSVRAKQVAETCFIGRLIVHPEFQGEGIGKRLLGAIEDSFFGSDRFELFTGSKSERNLRLYDKLGYRSFRRRQVDGSVELVFMEKRHPESA